MSEKNHKKSNSKENKSNKLIGIVIIAVLLTAIFMCFMIHNKKSMDSFYVNVKANENGKCKIIRYETIPETVSEGDMYLHGDYIYSYNVINRYSEPTNRNGWSVSLATVDDDGDLNDYLQRRFDVDLNHLFPNAEFVSMDDASYGEILESVNGVPVVELEYTFNECNNLEQAPSIPSGVLNINYAFDYCHRLIEAPVIPDNVIEMVGTFGHCINLKEPPVLPNSVENISGAFWGCSELIAAPIIPNNVKYMGNTFKNCDNLKDAPEIPHGVEGLTSAFSNCVSLTNAPKIPNSVSDMFGTFSGCVNLEQAPTIPDSVENMACAFEGCIALSGTIEINTNPKEYHDCFKNVDISNITLTGTSILLNQIRETGLSYQSPGK